MPYMVGGRHSVGLIDFCSIQQVRITTGILIFMLMELIIANLGSGANKYNQFLLAIVSKPNLPKSIFINCFRERSLNVNP